MSASLNVLTEKSTARDIFLARQPVLNKHQKVWGYELLFRSAESAGSAVVTDDLMATSSVIAHLAQLGVDAVLHDHIGFINVDDNMLLSDMLEFISPNQLVLEILEHVRATPSILARIAYLHRLGYRFALDDVVAVSDDIQLLLPHVDIIKIDISTLSDTQIVELARRFKTAGKQLLAEKVETLDQYNLCNSLDFDYFQGYYFARPVVLTSKKLSLSEQSLLAVLVLLSEGVSDAALESALKNDTFLSINLLRLVNTPAAGMSTRISSIQEAINTLGRNQLKRWIQILMYARHGEIGRFEPALLRMAATRGALLENIALRLFPTKRDASDIAFTVGIMSLMDILYNMPMAVLLEPMSLTDPVRDALLHRSGVYGDMLSLAEHLEDYQKPGSLGEVLQRLGLTPADFYEMEIAAFKWSADIAKAVN